MSTIAYERTAPFDPHTHGVPDHYPVETANPFDIAMSISRNRAIYQARMPRVVRRRHHITRHTRLRTRWPALVIALLAGVAFGAGRWAR